MLQYIRIVYPNQDTYEGWVQGSLGYIPEGQGTLTSASGVRYEGWWHKGLKHGFGIERYPSGDQYEGGWKEGHRHGYGEYIRPSIGRTYKGGFDQGREQGYATIIREPDGRSYDGGILKGIRHGYGVLTTPLGTMEGGFKFDKQEGWQEIRAPKRHDFSGTYREGKMWGVGVMTEHTTGKKFDGVWESNYFLGPGTWKARSSSTSSEAQTVKNSPAMTQVRQVQDSMKEVPPEEVSRETPASDRNEVTLFIYHSINFLRRRWQRHKWDPEGPLQSSEVKLRLSTKIRRLLQNRLQYQ